MKETDFLCSTNLNYWTKNEKKKGKYKKWSQMFLKSGISFRGGHWNYSPHVPKTPSYTTGFKGVLTSVRMLYKTPLLSKLHHPQYINKNKVPTHSQPPS